MRFKQLQKFISNIVLLIVLFEYSCVSVQNLAIDENLPPNKKIKIDPDLKNSNVELKIIKIPPSLDGGILS